VLRRHPGPCPVVLTVMIPEHSESVISLDHKFRVLPNERLVGEVEALIGKGAVSLR